MASQGLDRQAWSEGQGTPWRVGASTGEAGGDRPESLVVQWQGLEPKGWALQERSGKACQDAVGEGLDWQAGAATHGKYWSGPYGLERRGPAAHRKEWNGLTGKAGPGLDWLVGEAGSVGTGSEGSRHGSASNGWDRQERFNCMIDVLSLGEKEILSIPEDSPEKIFSGDLDKAKVEFRRLRSRWHPDTNAVDPTIIAHINKLFDKAEELLKKGLWKRDGQLLIASSSGKSYSFRYHKAEEFELGIAYVGDSFLSYFIRNDFADLVRIAQDHIEGFKFPDGKLKNEHEKSLPKLQSLIQVKDGYYIVIKKDPAYIRLSDVLEHFGGKIDPKHVAWMLSRLYNLSCFMRLANLVHHDISPQNCFIHPQQHYLALLGGWWYARKGGEKLVALPQRTITYGPQSLLTDKIAVHATNSELIKATGRDLLGDSIGSRLSTMGYPQALVNWLRSPAQDELAWDEYGHWEQVLKNSFGARKFIELKLESKDIYTR